jgi:hypothetical protein
MTGAAPMPARADAQFVHDDDPAAPGKNRTGQLVRRLYAGASAITRAEPAVWSISRVA